MKNIVYISVNLLVLQVTACRVIVTILFLQCKDRLKIKCKNIWFMLGFVVL